MPPETLLDDETLAFNTVPGGAGSLLDPGQYIAQLVRFEKMEDGEWGARRRWVFNMADAKSRTPIYEADGSLHECKQATSVKMGKKAKAREFFEALLGRELQDGEIGPALARDAIGKRALALVGPNANNWIEIIRLSPLPKNGKPATPPPPVADDDDGPNPFDN